MRKKNWSLKCSRNSTADCWGKKLREYHTSVLLVAVALGLGPVSPRPERHNPGHYGAVVLNLRAEKTILG